ncbi:MAG TPA: hypothetical protein VGJ93_12615 [Desulfuromonadaceae bacterium]
MFKRLQTGIVPAMLIFLTCLMPISVLAVETVIYNQAFESDNGGYTTDGAKLWGWDKPLNPGSPLKTNTSTKCWGTTQIGSALGTLDANIYSPTITLPQITNGQVARASFNAYLDVNYEKYGEGDFYISTDQMQTWQLLARLYEKMTETGWQRYSFNISEYAGKSINLRFRAYMQNVDPGLYIDDVRVTVEDMPSPASLLTLEANENANSKASCPWVYTWDGTEFTKDNDIYSVGRFPTGEMRDYYLLQKPLVAEGDSYNIEIHEVESEDSWTDQLGLWAIDHESNVGIAPDNKGNIVAYKTDQLVMPVQAFDNNGGSVLELIANKDNSGFAAYSKDYIDLDFGSADVHAGARLVLRVKGYNQGVGEEKPFIGPPAIVVQTLDANGVWQEVGRLNPRFEWSEGAFDLSSYLPDLNGDRKIRLLSISHGSIYHEIDFAGLFTGPQPLVHKTELILQSAHLGNNDVTQLVADSDNLYVPLTSGNKFSASFAALPEQPGMVRDFIILSEGYYIPKASTFFIFTWDGTEWLQRESYSFAATDSQRIINLSPYLPDPSGEYKVRIWQDYANYPAAIDYVGLQVGADKATLTSAIDLRTATSIFNQVQTSDDIRFEYPLDPISHLPRNRWSEYTWSLAPIGGSVTYTIAVSTDGHGTFNCPSPVNAGESSTCTITPAKDYGLSTLTDNGINTLPAVSGNAYAVTNINSNHVLTATFAAIPTPPAPATGTGDLNGDGKVDLEDALRALKIAVGIIVATPADIINGDLAPIISGTPQPDGKIDIMDVLMILKRVLNHPS